MAPGKHYEITERKLSEEDSVFVICYNHFGSEKLNARISIPDTCYKIIYSLGSHRLLLAVGLSNTAEPVEVKCNEALLNAISAFKRPN